MKLKTLFSVAVSLLVSFAATAQVVVNQMDKGSAQEDFFKAYDGVTISGTADWKAQGNFQYAQLSGDGKYIEITADKKIKAVRLLATGNSENAAFNPAVVGFKEAPTDVVFDNKTLIVADFAQAYDTVAGKQQMEDAVWVEIDLSDQDLKALYISRQWKKVTTDPEDTKGYKLGANGQSIRVFGFHVVLDGQEMPAIPEGPVVVEDPAVTKFVVADVEAKIDQKNKTITAELPFGTDLAAALEKAEIVDNQAEVDPVLDAEAMTLALGELVYTLKITVAEDPDAPSTNVLLTEAIFSNGVKAFIDNKEGVNTVTVPYLGEKPTFVSGQNEDKKATVSVEGEKIIVENSEAKAEYALSFVEYSAAPLEVGAEPYVFTGEEVGAWIASVYGWDAEKGIKFAKDVEDADNRRISEGKDRVYFFLPAADSVKLVSGKGENRPVVITVNGVASEVTKTAKKDEAITIALGNVPALVAIESNGNSGDGGFTSIQLVKAGEAPQPAAPKVTKFVIAGVEAVIDQAAKTITAEVPFGTDVAAALAEASFEDNSEDLEAVLDAEALTLTLGELVYALNITVGEEPEPDVVLFEAIFSNGAKGFIDNKNGVNTVKVPYIGEVPTFVSGRIEKGEATVALEGDDKIVVTNGDAKAEYALSFVEYSAAPLEVGAEPYVFTGEEVGAWIASVYGWDAEKGIKFAKDVEDADNRRISEGKDRVYFFLPAADSVKLVSGKGENRPVVITVNGVASEVTKTAKKDEAITIALGNVPALVAIESNGNSGDGGFTSIQLVKAGEAPQPAAPKVTKFVIAGVEAVIDQAAKTITAEVPFGTDVAAALAEASFEDNSEDLEAVLDAEALTLTLGELVYALNITVGEEPVEPQPVGDAIFYWQASQEAPANGAVLNAVGGTLTVQSTDEAKTVGLESAAYAAGVADDMKADGSKGWKMGGNALSLEIRLSEGSFLAGDVIYISGYNPWKISTTAEHSGDVEASLATGTKKDDYQVGSVALAKDAEVLYLMRAEGTSTGIAAIKVVRGGDVPGPQPEEPVYSVVGQAAILNTTTDWDVASTLNDMVLVGEEYQLEIKDVHLDAKTYEYKFVSDHKWGAFELPSQGNLQLVIDQAGKYDLLYTLKPEANEGSVVATLVLADALENITGASINVINSTLYITSNEVANIQVYTVDGRMIDNQRNNNYTRALNTGVYVIRVNNQAAKVVVK